MGLFLGKQDLKCLVIEDNEDFSFNIKLRLEEFGKVELAADFTSAKAKLQSGAFDLAFIDLDLDRPLAGIELVKIANQAKCYSVVLTGHEEDRCLEMCREAGAKDYLLKSSSLEAIDVKVKNYLLNHSSMDYGQLVREHFMTEDERTLNELSILRNVALFSKPVLIMGPTGVGKTQVARLIHKLKFFTDSMEKFISFSCNEISENLFESELFGHAKGAFTGANTDKVGKLKLADGGTLFIDEVGKMPLHIQDKLLKVIEEKQFYPLGSEKKVRSNFRLITAACEDLSSLVKEGKVRPDFYFRIMGTKIEIKGLKDRRIDIPLLLKYAVKNFESGRKIIITEEAMSLLTQYDWPGNYREIEYLVAMWNAKELWKISASDLPQEIQSNRPHAGGNELEDNLKIDKKALTFVKDHGIHTFVELVEEMVASKFYQENGNKARETIRMLGVSNDKFYKIMKRHQQRMSSGFTY